MTEILAWISANTDMAIALLFAISGMGAFVINATSRQLSASRQARMRKLKMAQEHELKMAQLGAQTETAKALAAAPEEAQRSALAQELLEAYGEAGEGLRNDEKGSLVRYEPTKES